MTIKKKESLKKTKKQNKTKEQTIAILAMQWWYHPYLLCDKKSTATTK